ncbi:MAG TPA: DoxX family membrane protein, partial [Polyangiaceae bacterium]|nr:DoxX family membrane protein [Polyangiaceae bacterium]
MEKRKRDIFGKVLGALFILSSVPKLLSVQGAVENFNTWHLGSTWRYAVGSIELLCGVLMFFTATKKYGA